MSSAAGPDLPPHLLAKRKRQQEDTADDEANRPSGAKRPKSPSPVEKRTRVLGPAPPPAPIDQRPEAGLESDNGSSSEDDDFGPSLPKGPAHQLAETAEDRFTDARASSPKAPARAARDEWMTMPPKQDDLAARMDPTKVRARGFNTGKSARAPAASGGNNNVWTETPEQKLKRLQDEAMGVKTVQEGVPSDSRAQRKRALDEAAAAKIREHTVSLVCVYKCTLRI